jgi:hypothetical protein
MTEPSKGSEWRHVKTDHVYAVINHGIYEPHMMPVVIYARVYATTPEEAEIWVLPWAEFMDGRFERVRS